MTRHDETGWEPVASMEHVLRDPLSAMTGYLELLLMEAHGPLRPEQVRALEAVQENVRALRRATDEVLEYADLQRRNGPQRLRRVDLGALLESAADALRGELEDRRWALELHPAEESVEVLGDPEVILRLVRGMASFPARSGDGTGEARVRVTWRRARGRGEIRVGWGGDGPGVDWSHPLGSAPGGPSPALARLLAAYLGGTLENHASEATGGPVLVLTLPSPG